MDRSSVRGRLAIDDAVGLDACVRCGLCAEACHYYRAAPDPRATPAYKLRLIDRVVRADRSVAARLAPHWFGAGPLDESIVAEWVDELYGRCTMCGRCLLHCTSGINIPALVRAARSALTEAGLEPKELRHTVANTRTTGNSMAIPREEWVATIAWLEDELRAETGDPSARLPLDQRGSDFLYTVNPREAKFFPLSILAAGAIFHAAGARWTLSSDAYDVTNYALYTGDDEAASLFAARLLETAELLGARALVLGECGHGFAANRWHAPNWRGRAAAIPVVSILEVVAGYVRDGQIRLDPRRNPARTTLHDPCNLARLGGIVEEPRSLLSAAVQEWVEMTPHGTQNFCCGGGGGQLAMSEYATRRLKAGKVKAEQIRATAARVVAAPCHNCIDQLGDLNREYGLGVEVRTVCELVAGALVWNS
jgi:Fe-S oxidoreductase